MTPDRETQFLAKGVKLVVSKKVGEVILAVADQRGPGDGSRPGTVTALEEERTFASQVAADLRGTTGS